MLDQRSAYQHKRDAYRLKHQERPPYVAPRQARVVERIGSGASRPLKYGLVAAAEAFYVNRAIDWDKRGYTVTWHDEGRWFDATSEGMPTVFCALQEGE